MATGSALLLLLLLAAACCAPVLAEREDERRRRDDDDRRRRDDDDRRRHGRGRDDPIITDFSGRTFGFGEGQSGAFFNVISEEHHQVSMKLIAGGHGGGTFIDGLGVRYCDHQIIAERGPDDNLHVFLNGERLYMSPEETEQEHTLACATGSGDARLLWHLAHPSLGQAVEVITDLFSISTNVIPEGTWAPAHLEFDALLLREPEHDLKGIVGGAYDRLAVENATSAEPDDNYFHGDETEYKMDSYFGTGHPHDAFGRAAAANWASASRRRQLIQRASLAFPLRFHVGAADAPKPAAAAGAGRKFGP